MESATPGRGSDSATGEADSPGTPIIRPPPEPNSKFCRDLTFRLPQSPAKPDLPMPKFLTLAIKLLVVAGLIWFVVANIAWRDRLVYRLPPAPGAAAAEPGKLDEAATQVGTVEGDWRAETIAFRPDGSGEEPLPVQKVLRGSKTPDGRTVELEVGFWTYWRNLDVAWFVLGAFLYFWSVVIPSTRWWWLLRVNGLGISWRQALRFSWIGLFFNNVMPGQTGGDLIKAVYVMRAAHGSRVPAVVSVGVDRVLGLASLAVLGAVAVTFSLGEFQEIALGIWGVMAAVAAVGAVAFSRRIREAIRLKALLERLPKKASEILKGVDQAVYFYRSHKGGITWWLLIGVGNHVLSVGSVMCMGIALGVDLQWEQYFVLIPVINILSAVPLAPGAWGVGEALYGYFFKRYGPGATVGVALSVLFRLHMTLWSMLGGVLVLFGERVTQADVEREMEQEKRDEAAAGLAGPS